MKLALISLLLFAQPQDTMRLDFRSAPIDEVIYKYTKETGVVIIKDPSIKTKLTILSDKPMNQKEAFSALFSALRVSGIMWKMENGFLILTKSQPRLPEPETEVVMELRAYKLNFLNAQSVASALNTLFNQNFRASHDLYSNSLIVNADVERHSQIVLILKQIDIDSRSSFVNKIFNLKYIPAQDLRLILNNILAKWDNGSNQSYISIDTRTNSLIVHSDRVNELSVLVKSLDVRAEIRDSAFVERLKNAKAEDVANLINQLSRGSQ